MEDHSNNYKRKSKGGAEKIREKKQKKLQIEAGSCFKIKDMFQKSFTTTNALNKNSNDDLPELKEIDNDQNNLKANETDVLNTLNKIDVIYVKNIKSLKVDSQSLDVDNKVVSDDLSNITTNVDFYEKPSKELIHQFLNYHPCQPNDIDFNTDKICIGFGLKDDQSIFVTGYSGVTKHFYDSIKEHEMSKTHINNLESFLMFESKDMHELVSNELNKLNIDITKCIGNSTDGAANMQGQYKGFTKWLTDDAPKQLHVWCYAHVLNLVISDVTQKTNESISLFSLLNKVAVFVRESYLRMNFWKNTTEGKNISFISTLGEIRWWSKEKSLRKVFGSLNDSQNSIFVQICQTLFNISTSESMNSDTRFNANVYLQMLIKFDTIITAQLFLLIFKSTTPLSNYLQTSGMDLLQSYKMVENTIKTLKDVSRKFIDVVEEDFKETRIKRKPKFHDEIINDTPYDCSKKKYEINVYNITLDTVIESLENRFSKHKEMYIDFEWLHPTNFKLINNLPENAMNKIAELLTDFSPNIDKKILQEQLIDFAGKWDSLSKTLLEEYSCMTLDLEKDDEEEESKLAKEHLVHKKTCKNCIFCCYQILWKYNVYATAYPELFLAYKFLLTLSITQVQCERTCGRFYYNVV
ncbi:hypothetical protein QTP88_011882 [Uroleucon formosanum]